MSNLFFDQNLEESLGVDYDGKRIEVKFSDNTFAGDYYDGQRHQQVFNYDHHGTGSGTPAIEFSKFKFYRFTVKSNFPDARSDYLLPPSGNNLLEVVRTRKDLLVTIRQIFQKFGYRLVLELPERRIKVIKDFGDVMISIPYSVASDTLQRLVFHLSAIHSNKQSLLVLEEPESHAFPYYTKYLAERIALDDKHGNQYFISTHNPYFLISLLEKTPATEISVYVTYLEDYQTKAKLLSEDDVRDILERELDAFFNIERFIAG